MALVLGALLVIAASVYMFGALGGLVLLLGALTALFLVRRGRSSLPRAEAQALEVPHPGIRLDRIRPAGFPGLVFALGVVFIFWFGAPSYRPIVLTILGAGLLGGLLAILRRR